jgi:transcription elongation factor Elf1
MPERLKKLKLRCPVCYAREMDVLLLQNQSNLYCIKCGFTGNEARVREFYNDLRKKYTLIQRRLSLEEIRAQ